MSYNLAFLNRSAAAQLSFDFIVVRARVDSSINFDLFGSRLCTREHRLLLFHSTAASTGFGHSRAIFRAVHNARVAEIQMRCVYEGNLIEAIYILKCFTPEQKEFNDEKLTTTHRAEMLMMVTAMTAATAPPFVMIILLSYLLLRLPRLGSMCETV